MHRPLFDGIHLVAVDLELVVHHIEREGKAEPLQGGVTARCLQSGADTGQEEARGRGEGSNGGGLAAREWRHGGERERVDDVIEAREMMISLSLTQLNSTHSHSLWSHEAQDAARQRARAPGERCRQREQSGSYASTAGHPFRCACLSTLPLVSALPYDSGLWSFTLCLPCHRFTRSELRLPGQVLRPSSQTFRLPGQVPPTPPLPSSWLLRFYPSPILRRLHHLHLLPRALPAGTCHR